MLPIIESSCVAMTTLDCLITNQDDVVVLDGTALVWTEPLG